MADETTNPTTPTEPTATGGNVTTSATTPEARAAFTPAAPVSEADADEAALGDAGKRALAREREARKALEAQIRDLQPKAKKLDEIEAANQSELEKEQKAREAAEQRVTAATTRAVRAEIKALAVKFADPEDAVLNLGDLTRFVSDDGEIDEKAIGTEIDAVLTRKPHLAKPEPTPEPRLGQPTRPTETLRPGAAPAEPERATNLYDAVAQALSPNN